MRIRILGTGCKRCDDLYKNAVEALVRFPGQPYRVDKVEDVDEFVRLGVRVTPALVFDDEVISTGAVLSAEEIEELIRERLEDGRTDD